MTARVRGKKRLLDTFRSLPEEVKAETLKGVMKSAEELARVQKALVPVDSGDLRDSITVTGPGETTPPYSQPGGERVVPDYGAAVTAGNTDARYPHLVEFGTTKAPAQPYFWPAYRSLRKRLQARISRASRKGIREAWKK